MAASRLNPSLFDKLVADLELEGLRESDANMQSATEANRSPVLVPQRAFQSRTDPAIARSGC